MIHLALSGIDAGLGVLLTYLVHSTVWIAAALLLTRIHRWSSPAARHAVWRAALLGPFASSALAPAWCRCWEWSLVSPSPSGEAWVPDLQRGAGQPLASALLSPSAARGVEAAQPFASWFMPFVTCWAVVALVALLLLVRAALRQRRALESRTAITDATCIRVLKRLAKRAGMPGAIRLSQCTVVNTPFVLNAREICLPQRALALDRDGLEAVLAHELAHIERRDGSWLNAALLLQALLWFQPLNRRLRSELQQTAELAADDRAVELTGNALGLARTLTQVASWVSGARFAPAVAMARSGSLILERVARLCESNDVAFQGRRMSRKPWLALAALAAVGACSPSIGAPYAHTSRARLAPSSPPASTPTGTPELPTPGLVDGTRAHDPRTIELNQAVTLLAEKEQRLQGQIERTRDCAAAPAESAQTRAELALLKRELAVTVHQRQQLEHYLNARMQAWSRELEQRFEHAQAALTSSLGYVSPSLLECTDTQGTLP